MPALTIVFSRTSGYEKSVGNIRYTHIYDTATLNRPASVSFLAVGHKYKSPERLLDVQLDESTLNFLIYPHNGEAGNPRFTEELSKLSGQIATLMQRLYAEGKRPKGSFVTIDLDTLAEVTQQSFFRGTFTTDSSAKYETFIFNSYSVDAVTAESICFPQIYVVEIRQNNEFQWMKGIFSMSSSSLFVPSGKEYTRFGKYSYALYLKAKLVNKFSGHCDANVVNCAMLQSLPPDDNGYIANIYKMEALENLCGQVATDTLKEPFKASASESTEEDDSDEEDVDSPPFVNSPADSALLEEGIILEVINKGTVKLSALIEYGVKKFIRLLRDGAPVRIDVDVPFLIKRGIVKDGNMYAIPEGGISADMLAEEVYEDIVICTSQDFPHNND